MRKIISVILCMLLLFTLAACNGDSGSSGSDTASSQAVTVSQTSGDTDVVFGDTIKDASEITNYHFVLEISLADMLTTSELWVMDNNMKFYGEGQIIYYKPDEGKMATYVEASNQLVIAPISEAIYLETPFTLADDIDISLYDAYTYVGTETFDNKTCYVFESTDGGIDVKCYVWADTGIIVKMDTTAAGQTTSYAFKDLSINTVTEDDLTYPAGAEVMDLTGMAG